MIYTIPGSRVAHKPPAEAPKASQSTLPRPVPAQEAANQPLTADRVNAPIEPTRIPFISNNCFLISLLRGLIHVPALNRTILQNVPGLAELTRRTDVLAIRNQFMPNRPPTNHEDPQELLNLICNDLPEDHELVIRTVKERTFSEEYAQQHREGNQFSASEECHLTFVGFPPRVGGNTSLTELIETTLSPTVTHEKSIISERTTFKRVPNHLLVYVNRATNDGMKNKTSLQINTEPLRIDSSHFEENTDASYTVTYGAFHLGESLNSGHYQAVIKIEGQWYLEKAYGSAMEPISHATALERLQGASLLYLERLASDEEVPPPLPPREDRMAIPKRATPTELVIEKPHGIYDDRTDCMVTAVIQLYINTPELLPKLKAVQEDSIINLLDDYDKPGKKRRCDAIRNEFFNGASQRNPINVVTKLGDLPDEVTLTPSTGTIDRHVLGGIVKKKIQANKDAPVTTINAAIIRKNDTWYLCRAIAEEIPAERALKLLKKASSYLLRR